MVAIVVMLLSCLACATGEVRGAANSATVDRVTDETLELRNGASTPVAGTAARITFVGVTDDSRCPVGVTCIWEGDAIVRLRVNSGSQAPVDLQLHANARFSQAGRAGSLTVTLIRLEPLPRADQPIPPDAYVAALQITSK